MPIVIVNINPDPLVFDMKRNLLILLYALLCSTTVYTAKAQDNAYVDMTTISKKNHLFVIALAKGDKQAGVWFDLNQNGTKEEDEAYDKVPADPNDDVVKLIPIPQNKQLRIYGELNELSVGDSITTLDITHCPSIEKLFMNHNLLNELDVSQSVNMRMMQVYYNPLKKIDVTQCTKLFHLGIAHTEIATADLSQNAAMKELVCVDTKIDKLNLSGMPKLEQLYCGHTPLTTLDLSVCPGLKQLQIDSTQITEIDLSNNLALTELVVLGAPITTIDVSKNKNLTYLNVAKTKITTLDIAQNTLLETLRLYQNALTEIDFKGLKQLNDIHMYSNRIGETNMEKVIESLETPETGGNIIVIDTQDTHEQNVCNSLQVGKAVRKKWKVYDYMAGDNNGYNRYPGTAPNKIESLTQAGIKLQMQKQQLTLVVPQAMEGVKLHIYATNGIEMITPTILHSGRNTVDLTYVPNGVYVLKVNNYSTKIQK